MLGTLKGILGGNSKQTKPKVLTKKKEPAPTAAPKTVAPKQEVPTKTRGVQYEKQVVLLQSLYCLFEANPWNEETDSRLRALLDQLQSSHINGLLAKNLTKEELEKTRELAQHEFHNLGNINRARVESLMDLSNEEMRKVIYEIILLFNINPTDKPPLTLSSTISYDKKGNPQLAEHVYPAFQEKGLFGVEGIERFFPQDVLEGNIEKGMSAFREHLESEFPELLPLFQQFKHPPIKALTTIGSLGGIGHKPESDLDLQIIFNTNPQYDFAWNDADYFLAMMARVIFYLKEDFYTNILSAQKRQDIQDAATLDITRITQDFLNEDELSIITAIFPSSYTQLLESRIWDAFNNLTQQQQAKLLLKHVAQQTSQFPYFEKHFKLLFVAFPLFKLFSKEKIFHFCFPHTARNLSKPQMDRWLAAFYEKNFLGAAMSNKVIMRFAEKKRQDPKMLTEADKRALLLEHLAQHPQRAPILKRFLQHMTGAFSIESLPKIKQLHELLRAQYDPEGRILPDSMLKDMKNNGFKEFELQMVGLIEWFSDWEAVRLESHCEIAIYRKIQLVERYLTRKYPKTELHLFSNILRKQRRGEHTPFLVSPEGSKAYNVMLNDLLLNPAVMLCGISPMPFELKHSIKVLASVGVINPQEFKLTQDLGGKTESFSLQELPNWGEITISRELFWQLAIPIYLRESEKVSHRNLPKALLNCWWLEMICCQEPDNEPITSLTRLLLSPEQRHFVKNNVENQWVDKIRELESSYNELVKDPWWLKFTEMLIRFEDESLRKQIVFCFAQHVRLTDIVDPTNPTDDTRPVPRSNWRQKAMCWFFNLFFPTEEERVDLYKFSQGRDDIGNLKEKELKELFVQSMQNVEKKLVLIGHHRAMKGLISYSHKITNARVHPQELSLLFKDHLRTLSEKLIISDPQLLERDPNSLNTIEKIQLEQLQQDRRQLGVVINNMAEILMEYKAHPSVKKMASFVIHGRINPGGDTLENAIFKYHFERNFKLRDFQVKMPISKTLSIPRRKISVHYNAGVDAWDFKSILSKSDVKSVAVRGKDSKEMQMFTDQLVEGLARCVFSGYVGFDSHNLTAFEKPPARGKSNTAANTVTHQDLQDLASAIRDFFPSSRIRPQELLQNIHYIKEIFLICNINYFNCLSAVVRDNYGDVFVVSYDISRINIRYNPAMQVGQDQKFPRFFQQFHSKENRQFFMSAMDKLKIKFSPKHPPKFKAWVCSNNFEIPVSSKFNRVYVDGIANYLWPQEVVGTSLFYHPQELDETFDSMGKRAIEHYRDIEAERARLRDKSRQRNAIQARAYMDRKRGELGL